MALEVAHLGVRIGSKTLLENISFEANPGTMSALVGPNGAGKTTLLRALSSLLPYHGEARFNHFDLATTPPEKRAQWMAYLPQFLPDVHLSVLEVLELARRPFGAPSQQRHAIESQINAFELHALLGVPLELLSGGQRQMVMIAAALLQTPKLLLLDEPIAHLDPKNRLEVLQRIKEVTKAQKITTLIVLHEVQQALHYCDTLLLLRDGALQAHVDAHELEATQLSDLYGVGARLFWHEGHPYVTFAHEHEDHLMKHQHKE